MSDNQLVISEGKTNAIISYLWIPGLIIAFILNNSKKNHFVSFHIRQMIGLLILSLLNGFLVMKLSSTISYIVSVVLLVLWIIGFIGAIKGEYKKIPLLGDQFQEWFKSI